MSPPPPPQMQTHTLLHTLILHAILSVRTTKCAATTLWHIPKTYTQYNLPNKTHTWTLRNFAKMFFLATRECCIDYQLAQVHSESFFCSLITS